MKVTAADVAKLAGVSRTTVSLVLTENTSLIRIGVYFILS